MLCDTHQTHDNHEVRTPGRSLPSFLRDEIAKEHAVKIDTIYPWTDSSTVLQWIQ